MIFPQAPTPAWRMVQQEAQQGAAAGVRGKAQPWYRQRLGFPSVLLPIISEES